MLGQPIDNETFNLDLTTKYLSSFDEMTLSVVNTICDLIADELKFAPKDSDIYRVKIPSMEESLSMGYGYLYTYKLCQKIATDTDIIVNDIQIIQTVQTSLYITAPYDYWLQLNIKKNIFYLFYGQIKNFISAKKIKPIKINIKDIQLYEDSYTIDVNKGEENISFRSKRGKENLEKETKQFKILVILWEYRQERNDNKILRKGLPTTLDNLVRGSGCPTEESVTQHIKRLNSRFQKEGLLIKIKNIGANKFVLEVQKC